MAKLTKGGTWQGSDDLAENLVPLDKLILLPGNPRHGDVGAISESLSRFGQRSPIKINEDLVVLGGNHTLLAAQALGWDHIAVTVTDGLEGAEQSAYALADNRLSDLATYDNDLLYEMTMHVERETGDLAGTGYDLEDLEGLRLEVEGDDRLKDEFFTPDWVFEGLGLTFDIDVAAPVGGVEWIPAKRYFTKADDGLSQQWEGLVWCNPPFSGAALWARKFTDHTNGVLLSSIPGDTTWFAELGRQNALIWFHDKGLAFHRPEYDNPEQIPWPTMFAAMGDEAEAGLRRLAGTADGVLLRLDAK